MSRGAAEGCRDLKVRWWDVSYLAMWPGVCSLSRRVSVMYIHKDARDLDILVFCSWVFLVFLVSFLCSWIWFGVFRFFKFWGFCFGGVF